MPRILVTVIMGVMMDFGEMTAPKHVLIARIINVCRGLEFVLRVRTEKWTKPADVQRIALPPPINVALLQDVRMTVIAKPWVMHLSHAKTVIFGVQSAINRVLMDRPMIVKVNARTKQQNQQTTKESVLVHLEPIANQIFMVNIVVNHVAIA